MPLPVNIQFSIIIYSFLSGLLVGAMFDLYRIIRGKSVPKPVIVIEDILFAVLAAIVVFTFLLYTDYAFLGPYVYLFMVAALFLYIKFISPIVMMMELAIIQGGGKAIRIYLKTFYTLLNLFFTILQEKDNRKQKIA